MKKIYFILILTLVLKISFDIFMIPDTQTIHNVMFISLEIGFLVFLLSPLTIPFYIITAIINSNFIHLPSYIFRTIHVLFFIFTVYYQWFVFIPKYQEKKRIENNNRR
jgi:hypothetical protein